MTDLDLDGDLLRADEKIEQGKDWQDTTDIPIAGESMTFGYTLLDERVLNRVQTTLPLEEFKDYKNDSASEEQQRLMELQRKDDLTDDEREELVKLAEEVNPEEEGRDTLGDDAVDALMDAGKHALEPTDDDVNDVMGLHPKEQRRFFGGELPESLTQQKARDALRDYMREQIEDQPFPIKFVLGQKAFLETVTVQGNGFQSQ